MASFDAFNPGSLGNLPRNDYSWLAELPDTFRKGQAYGRENELRSWIKANPNAPIDEVLRHLMEADPESGLKLSLLNDQNTALNGLKTFAAQPDWVKNKIIAGGGAPSGAGDAGMPPPQAGGTDHPVYGSQAEADAAATPPPTPVQTETITPPGQPDLKNLKIGDVVMGKSWNGGPKNDPKSWDDTSTPLTATPGPVAGTANYWEGRPKEEVEALAPAGTGEYLAKRGANRAELELKRPADEALVANVEDKLGRLEQGAGELLDEKGGPNAELRAITGNFGNSPERPEGYQFKGYGLPNAWLRNVSQEARNASAKLDNTVIQTGLAMLESMRQATASGASGFGQLAIEESRMLQNAIASYNQEQDPKQAAAALNKVRYWTHRVREIAQKKLYETYGPRR